jgi:YfiR/HmsC-like
MSYVRGTRFLSCIRQDRRAGRGLGRYAWLVAVAITVAWGLLAVPGLPAQNPKPTEFQVKAAYLYNFGRFIEWPANLTPAKTGSFSICVLGEDPFGPALDATLAGEMIGNQKVVARRISGPPDSGDCRILFISSTEASRLNKIIESLDKTGVLTVSDLPLFSQRGGMIQFVLEGNRIRFEVNLTATHRAGLTLSSELLKVATTIRRDRD